MAGSTNHQLDTTLTDVTCNRSPQSSPDTDTRKEGGIATVGAVASFSAFFAAAACCVLPAALAAFGVGAGLSSSLSAFVPFRWPLMIAAALAVAVGWALYIRRRKQCLQDASCMRSPPTKATFVLLCAATAFLALSAILPQFEAQIMRAIGPT